MTTQRVLPGRPLATWGTVRCFAIGSQARAVFADVNGDGIVDIVGTSPGATTIWGENP